MSVLAAVDGNARAWFDVLRLQPGAEVDERGWIVTDVDVGLCNSVFFPRWRAPEADGLIDAVLAAGRARGGTQLWWLGSACEPADLAERLDARGVVVDAEPLPAMAMALAGLPARALPDGLAIEPVAGPAGLDAFAVPFGSSYGLGGAALESVLAAFAAYGLDRDVRHLVGREGGRPVAAASIVVRDGVCGLYDVATVPGARGRGYGTALSCAALAAGRAAGARDAILHASPQGHGIYARLGFRTIATVHAVETRA